jgi:hypothetical protein
VGPAETLPNTLIKTISPVEENLEPFFTEISKKKISSDSFYFILEKSEVYEKGLIMFQW